ncbi:membrane protein [Gordonia phage AnarQue]|nr:membrane protein [Gordonia phage AnarQue]
MNWLQVILGAVFLTPLAVLMVGGYIGWTVWTWSRETGEEKMESRFMWSVLHLAVATIVGGILLVEGLGA